MDPFTERLLERTRARRENLQKKMAERPNASTRAMVKRPLAPTNCVTSEPVVDKVPQLSSKPSPSKRRCSEENLQPGAGEENQEPVVMKPAAPLLTDPPTDKKPPVGTASTRHSSSLENTASRPTVQSQPEPLKTAQSAPEEPTVTPAMHPPITREEETDPVPPAGGMRSRLQRLAEQRKCWDSSDGAETFPDTPTPLLNRRAEVPAAPAPSESSVPPLGRRGRLANLAATIGSWEDDLSHANIPQEKVGEKSAANFPKLAVGDSAVAAGAKTSSSADSTCSQAAFSPVKSSKIVLPGSQKDCVSEASSALWPVNNVQKSSNQGAVLRSSPVRATPSPPTPVLKSPLNYQAGSRGHNLPSSPQRPPLTAKPTIADDCGCQDKPPAGTPGVKSFLEHFEERCQERTNQSSPAGGTTHTKNPSITSSVTPNTRLVQERLRAAQCANTSTAELTQRQKLERESELARIRSRFQKSSNAWKKQHEAEESRNNKDIKEQRNEPVEAEGVSLDIEDQPTAPSAGKADTPTKCPPPGPGLMVSPPASASSPLKVLDEAADGTPEDKEEVRGTEMNVDQSINSAVINGLFDGILEQSEDQDDEEEEDALNISSMSLLTPLAETVAAVVKSPERMMTSTPASSFIVKNRTPDGGSKLGGFQRTAMIRTSSLESVEVSDEDPRLPYSIDAYRSTRLKESERPTVKQVIVRKEDVLLKAEEPRGSGISTSKHRIKMLTNEVNLQQTVIHQASQALNCCTDEEHGKGSQVEAEAQRLLLVATERREALKAELNRLKDPADQRRAIGGPEPGATSASRGSISLQEFRLPLKADFVCSTANKPEATKYSFFILIRAGVENMVATPLASTHRSLSGDTLAFPTKFTMSDVSSDFEIDIEVYGLVQKRDVCSDKKKKHSKSKAITPKRFLAITKSVQPPVVASPGGPNAVRTSNFVLVGSHKLTLSSIGRNKFPLEKVPFLCPLEGNIYLKLQCEVGSKVEERGFLTMFEDVSGFGAWHRRWCVLSGSCISYWTYPDDERRKNPIGRLSLANCTSQKVEPANREFCARPNTFELITVRPQREDDRETLVSQCQDTMCVTKNWLSADTKEERNLWMRKLNQILVDLRVWQPAAVTRAFIV